MMMPLNQVNPSQPSSTSSTTNTTQNKQIDQFSACSSNGSSRTVSGSSSATLISQHSNSTMSSISDIYHLTSPSLASTSLSSSFEVQPSSLHEPKTSESPAVSQLMALFQRPTESQAQQNVEPSGKRPRTTKTSSPSSSQQPLRKRQSRTQLNPQRAKRPFQPSASASTSNLDQLDHHKLTTFPQVYNTFVNRHGQVELTADPSPLPLQLPPSQHFTSFVNASSPTLGLGRDQDAIVFVEDYFEPEVSDPALATSQSASAPFVRRHHAVKSVSSDSSLSPFSTMQRRGSLAVKGAATCCVHCHKQLLEFAHTGFVELVCNDCAGFQQLAAASARLRSGHQRSAFAGSTATLPVIHSSVPRSANANGWYSTVRRKLRWRWRFKGLLPPGVTG